MRTKWGKRWNGRRVQRLTAAGVVPPAGQVGTFLLAQNGVPTEDLASELLLIFGVLSGTQIRHTMPGVEGDRVEEKKACSLNRKTPGRGR